jgi:dihydrofolate reductase
VSEGAQPTIALIVAIAANGVIGRDGALPWRLSTDLKRFRSVTMGKPLIMGRKTFVSLGRPLEGRDNIVLTNDPDFAAHGAIVVHSLEDALARGRDAARRRGVDELFVIGGAQIFHQAMPLAKRVYFTRVDAVIPGDVTFSIEGSGPWREVFSESHPKGPKDAHPFTFSILERA